MVFNEVNIMDKEETKIRGQKYTCFHCSKLFMGAIVFFFLYATKWIMGSLWFTQAKSDVEHKRKTLNVKSGHSYHSLVWHNDQIEKFSGPVHKARKKICEIPTDN